MSLTVLAIGYILMAVGELAPKFCKREEDAQTVAFFCGLVSLIIFAAALVTNTHFN